jgi:uroporphyrinogen decarboxylase
MDVSPSVYEHAAQFLGKTPWEVSRDGELIFQAHAAAYECYHHAPIMPGIDIYNLEAEAYGAEIAEPQGLGIPAVRHPPFHSAGDLLALEPFDPERAGRIPTLIAVASRLARRFPEADVRVPISGPFSIASNLVGFNNLLLEVATEPDLVAAALLHLVEAQVGFAAAVHRAGADVAFFESAACPPMLSPALFHRVELPALKQIMTRIGQVVGHPIPCIIGGNTTPIVEAMIETGTGYLACPFETNQEAFMAKVRDRQSLRIRVNMDLRIVASGTFAQVEAEADRVLRLIGDRPNCCLGTGALPYETRPENVLHLMEYICGRDTATPLERRT